MTFSEAPDKLGLPTIHSGYWDPLFAACEETETVLCLHVGSSGTSPTTSADAPPEIPAVLFGAYGMYSAVDWLYSKIPVRFPNIKICLSEGGIGWVAGIIDRLDHCYKYQLGYLPTWRDVEETPSEVLRRNFWFCALDDDSDMALRHRIGLEHVLVESDYPHADSSWPNTQAMLVRQLRDQNIPDDEAERITWRNAAELFRHEIPTTSNREHDRGRGGPQRSGQPRRRRVRRGRLRRIDDVGGVRRCGHRPWPRRSASSRPATGSRSSCPTARVCTRRCSRARRPGLVGVGIGTRAGDREVAHLVERSGARTLLRDPPRDVGGR